MSASAPRDPFPKKDFLNRKEAAIYLETFGCRIKARTLQTMASNNNKGKGPPFTRSGWRTVSYYKMDLDAWRTKRTTRVE